MKKILTALCQCCQWHYRRQAQGSQYFFHKFSSVVKTVYNILLIIGVAVSVIIIGVMGIRIITGSAEDKAEIKEQMVPYLIGCGVMFGAFTIWKIAMVIAGAVG